MKIMSAVTLLESESKAAPVTAAKNIYRSNDGVYGKHIWKYWWTLQKVSYANMN